ncbi:MAG: TetR/AcrR family transcriptional regulator [Alphaproteobacteria bacterium]|nr:TetR/AcrR family transcriptional regulator [Alphaproteobacteria bacterium]
MAERPDPEARWRRRAKARPDEILNAALDSFLEKGFEAARMEDVAAKADLSKAGVYLYFESKEALLKALIVREVAPVAQRAEALAASGAADPEAALRMIAAFALSRLTDPRVFAVPRLVISISNRFPDIATFYKTEVIDRARAALTSIVRAGTARGVFRDIDPDIAVRLIIGPFMFEALWRHVFAGEPGITDADAVLDLVMGVLKRGDPQ